MPRLWLTADLHLNHANILSYTNRPHPDLASMHDRLAAVWNDLVGPDDVVWILGDVVMGPRRESLALLSRLHGRLRLVAGNHDHCWSGHRRSRTWRPVYRAAGFETIVDRTWFVLAGQTVTASHFPYRGDSRDSERHRIHRPADDGRWLVHGHVHDRWRQSGRQINVGIDAWAGRPVAACEVADLIVAGPADRPPLPWPAAG